MKVSRTLITVALCLVSLGHSGRGVLGDNSVGRRLSGQEDVSAGMLGSSDQGEPVSLGFFGSVKYAITEYYRASRVFFIFMVGLIVLLIVSGIAFGCVQPDGKSTGWIGGGTLLGAGAFGLILFLIDFFYSKPLRPLP
ncbi:hypothetical protein X943_000104 [Babesia divergens]|uniref:Uncharacterized protein n=1 Tax=Babesia divergens TaxID=32595 RepID=A0AAD9G5F3_BABDI|nr:hypothetical protein X943_000104 [Babesia divergens]